MRTLTVAIAALAAFSMAAAASAQSDAMPAGFVQLELERSRTCVEVLAGMERLDSALAPLADRGQRLVGIAEAVALEDERVVDLLDVSDPLEARIQKWFQADQELARRYVATLATELNTQRATAREAIKTVITDAIRAVQAEADSMIAASGDLPARAGPCDGAIFVRSAVAEACGTTAAGALCAEVAKAPAEAKRFRFVDSPEAVWDFTEVRPWTNPTPLRVGPNGQLDGARTIGYARMGNIVVSVAFNPLMRNRSELTPEELDRYQSTNDSLGVAFTSPEVAIAPALGLRATLPKPLAGESLYVLHFGTLDDPEVLWSGAPGTGAPIVGNVRLGAAQVGRLRAGEPLTFTALRGNDDEGREAVFAIELTVANQARASQALLGYMSGQMGRDLAALVRPRGSQ